MTLSHFKSWLDGFLWGKGALDSEDIGEIRRRLEGIEPEAPALTPRTPSMTAIPLDMSAPIVKCIVDRCHCAGYKDWGGRCSSHRVGKLNLGECEAFECDKPAEDSIIATGRKLCKKHLNRIFAGGDVELKEKARALTWGGRKLTTDLSLREQKRIRDAFEAGKAKIIEDPLIPENEMRVEIGDETIVLNFADEIESRVTYKQDGNQVCAHLNDFVNLQESPAGFGDTEEEALADLRRNLNPAEIASLEKEKPADGEDHTVCDCCDCPATQFTPDTALCEQCAEDHRA